MNLPRLYPITDRRLAHRSHPEIASSLVESGCRWFQLRENELADSEFLDQAREAVRIAHSAGAIVLINDRIDIALAADADGVHLGQDDLPVGQARRVLGPDRILGVSSHSLEQALRADAGPVDYVAIGPIFVTQTKITSNAALGVELLASLHLRHPVVAIGGITRSNSLSVLRAGASSLAAISELMAHADPGACFRAWAAELGQGLGVRG